MSSSALAPAKGRSTVAALASTWLLACAAVVGAAPPTIEIGSDRDVRPGQTLRIAVGAVGTGVQLRVDLELPAGASAPAWLPQTSWTVAATDNPRLAIALSPPGGTTPGSHRFSVGATNRAGETALATFVVGVLAPLCSGALQYEKDGACETCPPHRVPNLAKTLCEPCPKDEQRVGTATACTACPTGLTSQPGEACGCGPARRVADGACVNCPPHQDSRSDPANCAACPANQHRPTAGDACAACPPGQSSAGGSACATSLTLSTLPSELMGERGMGNNVTVTATLPSAATAALTVPLTFGGTALAGTDYDVTGTRNIVIPNGQRRASTRLTLLMRRDFNAERSILISSSVAGHHVSAVRLTVKPRRPTVTLTASLATVREGAGARLVKVTATLERASAKALDFSLFFAGTATRGAGADYTLTGTERIAIAANALTGSTTLTVTAHFDALDDGETIVIGANLQSHDPTPATVRVTEPRTLLLALSSTHLRPGRCASAAHPCLLENAGDVTVTVSLTHPPPAGSYRRCRPELAANFVHTATEGADFRLPARQGGKRLNAGGFWEAALTLEVLRDSLAEGTETLTLIGRCGGSTQQADPHHTELGAIPLTVQIVDAGRGTLTVSAPTGGHVTATGINCGSGGRTDCRESYEEGEKVTVEATADTGHRFVAFRGACTGETPRCEIAIGNGPLTLWVDFALERRELTVTRPANGHVSSDGIDCGSGTRVDCSETHNHGKRVTLTATGDAGHELAAWSGACTGTRQTCQVTMDADKTVGATFRLKRHQLLVTPPENGRIAGGDVDCGSRCAATHDHGDEVELVATPATGHELQGWSGACDGDSPRCEIVMDGPKTVGATFAKLGRTLTVTPPTSGAVTGPGIDCGGSGTDCDETKPHGAGFIVRAAPAAGQEFEQWGGACSGTAPKCWVKLDADKTVSATFVPARHELTVTPPTNGHVSGDGISCGAGGRTLCEASELVTSTPAKTFTLRAHPADGYDFAGWTGACSGTAPTCPVTLDADKTVGATFRLQRHSLTVTRPTNGSVTSGRDIDCGGDDGTDCGETYDHGTEVTLTATPAANHRFDRWAGACFGSTPSCKLEMDGDKTATARFKPAQRSLTVKVEGGGTVTGAGDGCSDTCTTSHDHDSVVTLTATPAANRAFDRWADACSGTTPTCSVTLDADKTATANFKAAQRRLTVTSPTNGHVSEGSNVNCGDGTGETACSHDYDHAAAITLTANPDSDYEVDSWSGDCATAGSAKTCALTMSAARNASVTFKRKAKTLTVASPSNGHVSEGSNVNCGSGAGETTCSHDYAHDAAVTLTANPDSDYEVDAWGGDCAAAGSATTCALTMSAARSVSVTFKRKSKTLTVASPSNGHVSEGSNVNCGDGTGETTCSHDYAHDAAVTLTANPNSDYEVDTWGGDCATAGSATTCDLTMSAARSASVTFKRKAKTLTVSSPSNGHVSEGSNVNCGDGTGETTCSHDYAHDAAVTLTANPDSDYEVDTWGGDCATAGSATTCDLTMSVARSASVTFKRKAKTLTVSAPSNGHVSEGSNVNCGDGAGETSCSHDYAHDASVTLTANPDSDYEVDAWGGDCAGSATTCALTMSAARSVSITFKRKAKTLTVSAPSNGHVSEGSNVNCGDGAGETTCSHDYAHDSAITLTANPNTGYEVDSWGGDCAPAGSASTCALTMSAARSVSVTFKRSTKTLTISPTPSNGSVTSSPGSISCGYSSDGTCSHSYATGTNVSLSTTAATNYNLGAWGGACADADRSTSCSLTMNADRTASATFVRNPLCGTGGQCTIGSSVPAGYTAPVDGVCKYTAPKGCTVDQHFRDRVDTLAEDGDCGTKRNTCKSSGGYEELDSTTTHHRWRCLGTDGTTRWSCVGVDGWRSWSCTSGYSTQCPTETVAAETDPCAEPISATDDDSCNAPIPPPCNLEATSEADACPSPGTHSEPPADTFVDGVCDDEEFGMCETDGEPAEYNTTRVDGECSETIPNACDAGKEKNYDYDSKNKLHTWTCEGIDGTATWTCPGTAGDWNWTCTNDTLSQSCSKAVSGRRDSCSAPDPASDAPCKIRDPECRTEPDKKPCKWGNQYNVMNVAPTHGACGTAANACTDGSTPDESPVDVAAINGACNTAINRCTAGNPANPTNDGETYRWTCAGTAGTANWRCPGTAGKDTWECRLVPNGVLVDYCEETRPATADDCSASIAATNASCSHNRREACVARDGEWTPEQPARPRNCRDRCRKLLDNHTHQCTAQVGSTCTYKQHTSPACTNHKDAICRPYPKIDGYCTVRGWEDDEDGDGED